MRAGVIRAACYCRVSTESESQASSLENQREFFREFLRSRNIWDFRFYSDEGISGTKLKKRKAFMNMLKDAGDDKFDIIFVKDVSRFARNTLDFLTVIRELKSKGVRVHFVGGDMDSSEADETYLTILAAMAQAESANTSKRIKFSKDLSAEKGRVPNFVYGYKRLDNYTLEPFEPEAGVVREIFGLYVSSGWGAGKIAAHLNALEIPTKKGKGKWAQATISEMLKNPLYAGRVVNHKSHVEDFLTSRRSPCPEENRIVVPRPEFAIIDEATFTRAGQETARRLSLMNLSGTRHSPSHAFSNLLYCVSCGRAFRRRKRKVKSGEQVFWVCSTRSSRGAGACPNTAQIPEDRLLAVLTKRLESYGCEDRNMVRAYLESAIRKYNDDMGRDPEPDPQAALNSLSVLRQRKREQFESGIISLQELTAEIAELEAKLKKIRELPKASGGLYLCPRDLKSAVDLYFQNNYKNDAHLVYNNAYLKKLLLRIDVRPDGGLLAQFHEPHNLTLSLRL